MKHKNNNKIRMNFFANFSMPRKCCEVQAAAMKNSCV